MQFLNHDPKQYRGYGMINQIVHERIAQADGFQIGRYLGDNVAEASRGGLTQLLGTYEGSDTDGFYRNGEPNSLNVILWYIVLSGLARDIGSFVIPPNLGQKPPAYLNLRPEFAAALTALVAWPNVDDIDMALQNYWLAIMRYDAPENEFTAWQTYVKSSAELADLKPEKFVEKISLAILFNPYFLLGVS